LIYNGFRKMTATPRDMNATRRTFVERVFEDLIDLQTKRPARRWRAAAIELAIRLSNGLATGLAIGIGIAVGRVLAG